MSFVPGVPLNTIWDQLDTVNKEATCRDTWAMIYKWRKIPRPAGLIDTIQCLADGSIETDDPLLEDLVKPPRPLYNDEAFRRRICERYHHFGGRRYAIDTLDSMLLKSQSSVFTHADIVPRNIMVDEEGRINGIIDWENAGWYPDYWEYSNMMRPSEDIDWQKWMDDTAGARWDLSGINATRRVLH